MIFDTYYGFQSLKYFIYKKKEVLVYLGLNQGKGFDKLHWQYRRVIGVEANPDLFEKLIKRYKRFKHIHLVFGAATSFNGTVTFNITDNRGLSSSIGLPGEHAAGFKIVKSVTVPAINLCDLLFKLQIDHITDYVSDIQGNDLEVLKTMKPYLETKKIGRITAEVTKNKFKNLYLDMPDNSEAGFESLLGANYVLVSKGWEDLKENRFRETPESWGEMDCMWKLRT